MKHQKRSLSFLCFVLTLCVISGAQIKQPRSSIAETRLRQYVELRLQWADWNQYSSFIAWPDEPGWDCWWVSDSYRMGQRVESKSKVIIPVTYDRIGLFCMNLTFENKPKAETIDYELIHSHGNWKVNGPVPDYPYVSVRALRNWLRSVAADVKETKDRKQQAEQVLIALGEREHVR